MNIKKIFLIIFIFLFFLPSSINAQDKGQVIFINQVRGGECCGTGNLDYLKTQIEAFKENSIPAYFALRYDVVNNQEYVDYLLTESKNNPQIIKLGLLTEIIPSLTNKIGVKYNDQTPELNHWYNAQNIYTIGYQIQDRKKLIDEMMTSFKKVFGYYPTVTSSWMIDTDSVNYLKNKYGVIAHQITREQWGTDSYTLYGGPPHYPYPGSQNWLFIPDYQNKNAVMILRQTVTDPLNNYGDLTSSHTSQPNDYTLDGKTIEYFKTIVNNALFKQKQTGFTLLGLENTAEEQHQIEFVKQIEYIAELRSQDKIIFSTINDLKKYWFKKPITSYQGFGAEFITTPNYRLRIRTENNTNYITDIRIYNTSLTDPYNHYVAQKNGYWIAPFIFDGSHIYPKNNIFPQTINDVSITRYYKKFSTNQKIKLQNHSIIINNQEIPLTIDVKNFNQNRFRDYPYYIPEPLERTIDPKKTQFIIDYNNDNDIILTIYLKDKYNWPVTIYPPVELKANANPHIDIRNLVNNADKYVYQIKTSSNQFEKISFISDNQSIKNFYFLLTNQNSLKKIATMINKISIFLSN